MKLKPFTSILMTKTTLCKVDVCLSYHWIMVLTILIHIYKEPVYKNSQNFTNSS